MLQSGICRAVHTVTDLEKIQVRISKGETDEQQMHSMIPKTERYTDTLKQVKDNMSNTNAFGRKGGERDCTQMPVTKKERTDH